MSGKINDTHRKVRDSDGEIGRFKELQQLNQDRRISNSVSGTEHGDRIRKRAQKQLHEPRLGRSAGVGCGCSRPLKAVRGADVATSGDDR